MRMITTPNTLEKAWSNTIMDEITACTKDWWIPWHPRHQEFEQAHMKFVNQNLNYYNVDNMLLSLQEGYVYNTSFVRTLEFCEYMRTRTGQTGPFGRMCIWKLPSQCELLLHVDAFKYHHQIIRNIFIVSDHDSTNSHIKLDYVPVEYEQGTYFQFQPAVEWHTFRNNSDRQMYFLGFDYWDQDLYTSMINDITFNDRMNTLRNDPIRSDVALTNYDCLTYNTFKYMSDH